MLKRWLTRDKQGDYVAIWSKRPTLKGPWWRDETITGMGTSNILVSHASFVEEGLEPGEIVTLEINVVDRQLP